MNRIVILGATSGIGLEIAKLYIAAGWQVGAAGRRTENLEALRAAAPDRVKIRSIDITAPEAEELLLRLIADLGGCDLLLHCAGIGYNNPQLDAAREIATAETNTVGFTRIMDTAFDYFRKQGGGHLAAISSIARDQRPRRSGGLLRQQTLPEHLSRRIGTTLTDAAARHPNHRHPARIRGHTPAARREIPDADAPRKSRHTNRPGAGTTETAHRHRPPLRRAGIFLEADSRMALGAAADPHEIRPVSKISPDTPCSRHSYPPLKFPQ